MSEASERERVILDLLDSLSELGFDLESCVFEWTPSLGHWTVRDATHASSLFENARIAAREDLTDEG